MRRLLIAAALALAAFAGGAGARDLPAAAGIAVANLPAEARQTLVLIKRGGPFPFRRDGVVFGNFEQHLPFRPRGYYREYTVPTPGARDRGARRIIAGAGRQRDVRTSGEY